MRVFVLVLIAAFIFCPVVMPEDAADLSFSGTIESIDWVGATMTVCDTTFTVPQSAKITKGSDTVSFSEINVKDYVLIKYRIDSDGKCVADSITVRYMGGFPT